MKTPIATAWPVHAITTGVGNESSRSARANPPGASRPTRRPPALSTGRSNPAEKTPGRPASRTTARSAMARSSAASSSPSMAGDSTFTLPSSMVIVAIESLS